MTTTTPRVPAHLCLGYRASRPESETGDWLEMLYAALPDGTVLKTDWGKTTNDFGSSKVFHRTALTYSDIKLMIAAGEIEFIGNYPIPKAA